MFETTALGALEIFDPCADKKRTAKLQPLTNGSSTTTNGTGVDYSTITNESDCNGVGGTWSDDDSSCS